MQQHSHEAIIPPDEWEIVQLEMARRKSQGRKYSGHSIFSSRIICGDCGQAFGSKVWNSTDKYRRTVWQCNGKYKGKHRCSTPHLAEEQIKAEFVRAFNSLIRNKDELIRNCRLVMERYTDCTEINAELARLNDEIDVVTGLTRKWVTENATTAQDSDEFMERYREYDARYQALQARVDELEAAKLERQDRVSRFELFIRAIRKQNGELTAFDESAWLAVIDTVTVMADGKMVFRFVNGMEVEE